MKRIPMIRILLMAVCLILLAAPMTAWNAAQAAVTPVSVRLSQERAAIDMARESRLTLTAVVLPANASQRVDWSSSDTKVAKVSSSGVVTARKRGVAVITARAHHSKTVLATCTVTVTNSNLPDGISLGLTAISMERFSKRQLTASVWPGTADTGVKWKTSNRYIVSVSDSGLLTANKAGTATITCYSRKDDSVAATVQVTVFQKAAPSSIALTPATDVIGVGEVLQLTPVTTPADACQYFTWKTSSSSRATVSDSGLVTAKRAGLVTITCTSQQNTHVRVKREILVVAADSPRSISLGMTALTLNPGNTYALSPTVLPANRNQSLKWKSDHTSVVSVSASGVLTAKKAGTATITATSAVNANLKAKLTVKVENLPAPTSLSISGSSVVAKGQTIQLTVTPSPARTSADVKWTSNDRKVARVDDSGVVTGVKGGRATITATSKSNKRVTATFTVTVSDPASPTRITLNTASFTLESGATFALVPTVYPADSQQGVNYSTSSSSIARVDSKGVITGRRAGTAVITVTSRYNTSIAAAVQVTVVDRPAPTSITLSASSTRIEKGSTVAIVASPVPSTASRLFRYSSSSSYVASVSDDGVVTARRTGTVKITVQSKKNSHVKAEITLVVCDETTPLTLSLSSSELFLGQDDTAALSPVVTPATASTKVSWASSNRSVAKVSSNGTVRAVGQGMAVITCATATGNLTATCTVTVFDTTLTRVIPARTTNIAGISGNMAKIEAIRRSAVNQVTLLQKNRRITNSEAVLRREIINRAFEMQAFPWMTLNTQEYWSKAYAYKRYMPGNVYYGLPYIQTSSTGSYLNRRYNVAKALAEGRYYSSGKGYYLLNQNKLLEKMYVGNDCSAFVSMSMFGTDHVASYLNTTAIAKSNYYNTINSYADLRPGDILVKGGDHVILFLYYTNAARTEMMIIEQGGDGNTVICSLYNPSWFSSRGYVPRRRVGFATN
ncbi:MAG: Ig-like domain-containing protein [Clostridia bacterium]|nr:Ig-like domain-containing protein [Clostridia bacterium]